MNKNDNLLIGGVALLKYKRIKHQPQIIIKVRDEFRLLLSKNSFFDGAPFNSVSLIFKYGEVENLEPQEYRIDHKNNGLNISVMVNIHQLIELKPEMLESFYRKALIEILCDVSANYDLPYEFLDEYRKNI